MIKAIIFDFDGVIMDTHSFNMNAVADVFKKKGVSFSEETYNKYFTGRKLKESLQLILNNIGRENELNEFIALKKEHDIYFSEETKAYADTLAFIQKYKNKYRMVIATGSRPTHLNLTFQKYKIKDVFEATITAEDTAKGKPDPEIYKLSLGKLKIKPYEAVVIEDTPVGIKAAKAAGIKCIAVTNTYPAEKLTEADLIVHKLTDSKVNKFLTSIENCVD